jgi:hypothetical protein
VRDFLDVNPSPRLDARKDELIAVVEELTTERLGKDTAHEIADQLRSCALVSTTDHHSIIQHPFFLNADIISAVPYLESSLKELKNLIVFSFASVSVNNASGFPRGLMVHSGINGSGSLLRLPILPDKMKMSTVYAARGYAQSDIDRIRTFIVKKEYAKDMPDSRRTRLLAFIDEFLATDIVMHNADLCSQITKINYRLWPRLFYPTKGSVAKSIPNLVYLEIETIVKKLLVRHHLTRSSFIGKVLFDRSWQTRAIENFDGICGAFEKEKATGTHFFWGIDEAGHRVRLAIQDDALVSRDGSIRIALTPASVAAALEEKKIFPSMLLCYILVSLYYGFKCLGGFCQVHDLTMTKAAWQKTLQEMGEKEEAEALTPIQTKELDGDGMVLAYYETAQGDLVPTTGIDMVLDGIDTPLEYFADLSRTLSLSEAMKPLLPEMYTVLYSNMERDPALASIKPEAIMHATGLQQKLRKEIIRRELSTHGLERVTS